MLKKSLFIISILIAFVAMRPPLAIAQVTIGPGDIDKSRSLIMLKADETVLSDYREKDGGMFSNMWAVYILSEGDGEKKDWFIELNGKRSGPFENFSRLISFSPNGENVVFAAKEKGNNKWSVYVNGKRRWSYDGLAWATFTWPVGLKGNSIRSQTKAVAFKHSQDNRHVSFFSYRKEDDNTLWVNVTNGQEGRTYTNINTNIRFLNGKSAYWGWKGDEEKYFVVGNQEYGPYAKAYNLKVSDNKKHFAFIAESGGKSVLVLNGKEISIAGKLLTHALGDNGDSAVAYTYKGRIHVLHNGVAWLT